MSLTLHLPSGLPLGSLTWVRTKGPHTWDPSGTPPYHETVPSISPDVPRNRHSPRSTLGLPRTGPRREWGAEVRTRSVGTGEGPTVTEPPSDSPLDRVGVEG